MKNETVPVVSVAGSFCPRCGQPIAPGGRFCGRCGAPAAPAVPPAPVAGPAGAPVGGVLGGGYAGPAPPAPANRRALYVLLGVAVVVVVVLLALFLVPVAHPFSASLATSGDTPGVDLITFPSGAPVHGTWTSSGGSVQFEIVGFGHLYSENGTSGAFSFTATLSFVEFEAISSGSATVSVSGSYSSPLL